jgi:hypothetical protein
MIRLGFRWLDSQVNVGWNVRDANIFIRLSGFWFWNGFVYKAFVSINLKANMRLSQQKTEAQRG